MLMQKNNNQFTTKTMSSLILQALLIILISFGIAMSVQSSWTKHIDLYHTILESFCIFIALSIFTSFWYTYDKSREENYILGFGYLTVSIFDTLHIYYHLKLDLSAASYFDLSTRFWVLGRIAEAATILMMAVSIKVFNSKYVNLLFSLGISAAAAYFVVGYHDALPLLLTAEGVTPLKVFFEYGIIAIYIVSMFYMRNKLKNKGKVTYEYIFIAIFLSVCAELCFTTYILISNITWTLGHILKIMSYFYLFKGGFISTVIFPYQELEIKHKNLERANAQLNAMSNTMKDVLDALPIGIQEFDDHGKLKYTNKRFNELLQCKEDEMGNLDCCEMAAVSECFLQSDLERSEPSTVIRSFTSLSGQKLKLSVKTQRISNGILLVLNDTKQEQELQNLNIQTETILNAINNGVIIIDEHRRIVLANKVFEDIYEVDADKIIGMDIDNLNEITHLGCNKLTDSLLRGDATGQVFDVYMTSFKGNKKELSICISSIKNIDGDIIGRIGIITDVTEQKIEQQRMIQQEKLALLGQMGAGIVHETRNFLTTIKGRCQLIDMVTEDKRVRMHSAKINSDVEEVNNIISEFLFLSKPRETQLVEVSIHDVFESIKGIIETSSLVKGVDLEISLCENERYMLCDESQMKQVILNICKNGIDAMAELSNAKLVVETDYQEETNEVIIRIKDNGKGISKEHLEKMGTPFFTTKTSGTGLGLSVCYKIIKEHGGRIDVQSELYKGTTFIISLPCIADEEAE